MVYIVSFISVVPGYKSLLFVNNAKIMLVFGKASQWLPVACNLVSFTYYKSHQPYKSLKEYLGPKVQRAEDSSSS